MLSAKFITKLFAGLLFSLSLVALLWLVQRSNFSWPSFAGLRRVDVVIQGGHENRLTGKTGAESRWGKEQQWTPVVADAATRALELAGFSVLRVDAAMRNQNDGKLGGRRRHKARLALFLHFDGAERPCSSGASVGYSGNSDPDAAWQWKDFYRQHWPFAWMPDNFTVNLQRYYGYRLIDASDAELVLELGELTCNKQAAWLQPRLEQLGDWVADYAMERLCHPGGHNSPAPPLSPNCEHEL